VEAAPSVSVIVPALDAAATLGRTLACLAEQRGAPAHEVIVVDDGSRDGTAELAERAGARVLRERGLGPGAARNRGAAVARGGVLAFTDADCFPAPGWLAAGVRALAAADLVQGRVEPEAGVELGPFDRTLRVTRERGLYETANLLVRRELFDRLGGFVAPFAPDVGKELAEDTWLGWRARRAGARTAFADDALVHHAVFRRRARGYVAERRRLVHFPELARQVPELRRELFFARVFLSPRSAAFDAALVGFAAAAAARAPVALAAALPYAALVTRQALDWGRLAPRIAVVEPAADAIAFAALVRGSLRARSPLL
jgi:glycosyltransferase involved in cell wall biosynthesis